jgi:hypothetical protein
MATLAVVGPGTPWDPAEFAAAVAKVRMTERPLRDNLALFRSELHGPTMELLTRQIGAPSLGKNLPALD